MPQFDDIHNAVIIFVESVEFVADFFEPRIPRINMAQPAAAIQFGESSESPELVETARRAVSTASRVIRFQGLGMRRLRLVREDNAFIWSWTR